ncbi:MAG: endo-1,4-beta-xylanase, partial [Bacteroidota bacterium]
VKMQQHEFAFGSAITAARIAGNNDQNLIYEDKIINLDGKGHGFNWVVFENDMKWRAWEDNWFVSNAELANAVQWLRERNIKIRGHNLVWPGRSYLPSDVVDNLGNTNYLRQRIDERIETIMNYNGLKGEIDEWDILNEIATNRDLETAFRGKDGFDSGREIYEEIYNKAREEDPETGLWINDYVTLSLKSKPGNTNYDNLKKFTGELIDAGIDMEGIGFQGHIGGSLNSIPDVLETIDDFYNAFGLKAKITEYDLDALVDEELAAQYLRDFMTAIFSHPSMDGFLMWGFWDSAHWKNESPMYYSNWQIKPSGEAFIDMVFNEWWTEELADTDADGKATVRGFKGTYEISYVVDGELVTDEITLTEDREYEIIADVLPTNTYNPDWEIA